MAKKIENRFKDAKYLTKNFLIMREILIDEGYTPIMAEISVAIQLSKPFSNGNIESERDLDVCAKSILSTVESVLSNSRN